MECYGQSVWAGVLKKLCLTIGRKTVRKNSKYTVVRKHPWGNRDAFGEEKSSVDL